MNLQELTDNLKKTKEDPTSTPQLVQLITSLEDFIELYYVQRNSPNLNEEKFIEDLTASYQALEQSLETMANTFGVSGQFLKQYVSDPNNFTQEQWAEISKWEPNTLTFKQNTNESQKNFKKSEKIKKQKIKA